MAFRSKRLPHTALVWPVMVRSGAAFFVSERIEPIGSRHCARSGSVFGVSHGSRRIDASCLEQKRVYFGRLALGGVSIFRNQKQLKSHLNGIYGVLLFSVFFQPIRNAADGWTAYPETEKTAPLRIGNGDGVRAQKIPPGIIQAGKCRCLLFSNQRRKDHYRQQQNKQDRHAITTFCRTPTRQI